MDAFLWWTGAVFWSAWLAFVCAALVTPAHIALRKRYAERMLRARLRAKGIDQEAAEPLKNHWAVLWAGNRYDDSTTDRQAPL